MTFPFLNEKYFIFELLFSRKIANLWFIEIHIHIFFKSEVMRYILLNGIFVILIFIPVHLSAQIDNESYNDSTPILHYTKLNFSDEPQKIINDVFPDVDFYSISDLRRGGGFPGGSIKATYRNKEFLLPNDFNLLLFSINSIDRNTELYQKNEVIQAYLYLLFLLNGKFKDLKIETIEIQSGNIVYPISDQPNVPSDYKSFDVRVVVKFSGDGIIDYWRQGEFFFKVKDQRIIVTRGFIVHSKGYKKQYLIWSDPTFGAIKRNSSSEPINQILPPNSLESQTMRYEFAVNISSSVVGTTETFFIPGNDDRDGFFRFEVWNGTQLVADNIGDIEQNTDFMPYLYILILSQ